jgi:hypothetical protein
MNSVTACSIVAATLEHRRFELVSTLISKRKRKHPLAVHEIDDPIVHTLRDQVCLPNVCAGRNVNLMSKSSFWFTMRPYPPSSHVDG